GRGGREVLHFDLQEFRDRQHRAIRRSRTGPEGVGDDGRLQARWTGLRGVEWRSSVPVHARDLLRGELQDPGGGRLLLAQALRGRKDRPLRLAQGQVRSLLAGRAHDPGGTAGGQEREEGESRDGSHAADGQDGYRQAEAGLRDLAARPENAALELAERIGRNEQYGPDGSARALSQPSSELEPAAHQRRDHPKGSRPGPRRWGVCMAPRPRTPRRTT